ncbi:hypothetical protein [Paraburkholderia sp. SIMBA_053]|uniref:hypothetical protein n=1 Tax=Paraburkholderia sp. SIMBA_053 TaxID=3085794 RepID=UPI00397E4383
MAREEPFFERGVIVKSEAIRCWCDESGKGLSRRVMAARRKQGSTRHLDEIFATCVAPYLFWCAIDDHRAELDISPQKRCDKPAAKRFFKRVLGSSPVPRKTVGGQLRSYLAAKAESNAYHEASSPRDTAASGSCTGTVKR